MYFSWKLIPRRAKLCGPTLSSGRVYIRAVDRTIFFLGGRAFSSSMATPSITGFDCASYYGNKDLATKDYIMQQTMVRCKNPKVLETWDRAAT